MALVPLGEKVINILVNGSEEASFKQRTETTNYDLHITTSASIDDPIIQNYSNSFSDDDNEPSQISGTSFQLTGINLDMHIEGEASAPEHCEAEFWIHHANGTRHVDATGTANDSDYDSVDETFQNVSLIEWGLAADDLRSADLNYTATVQQSVSSSYTVDDVTRPPDGLPNTVVSRGSDTSFVSSSDKTGIQISVSQDWPEIGGELSSNTDDSLGGAATRAYVHRVSDGQLMGDTDISALTAGDTFTIDLDNPLNSGESYNFVVDAEGSMFTTGRDGSSSFPYTSSDGNLEIVDGASGETGTFSNAFSILTVGDVGF